MGKNSRKDKEKDETSRGSQNQPKPTTPNQSTTPYPARRVHNDPKVAQQAPTGTVPHQNVGANSTSTTTTSNTPKTGNTTTTKNNTYPLTQQPTVNKDGPFVIPRVDKRTRDPSTSSKGSEESQDPPPPKDHMQWPPFNRSALLRHQLARLPAPDFQKYHTSRTNHLP